MLHKLSPLRRNLRVSALRPVLMGLLAMAMATGWPGRAADDSPSNRANGPESPAKRVLRVGRLRVGKVLILGNSVTRHPPAPAIGWLGDWGMAASAPEKDFVHLLADRIAEEAGGKPELMIVNIAEFERHPAEFDVDAKLKDALAFEADVIILAIGANVPALATEAAKAEFRDGCTAILARLKRRGDPTIFVRSEFWQEPTKEGLMKEACREVGGIFVELGHPAGEEANLARSERKFEHDGVGGHPGDRGMRVIADALWKAMQDRAKPEG